MRTMLSVAAIAVFVVSTGLLEMVERHDRPITDLPPAMGHFGKAKVDATVTSSITPHRLDER
jgi:hypothetical protein